MDNYRIPSWEEFHQLLNNPALAWVLKDFQRQHQNSTALSRVCDASISQWRAGFVQGELNILDMLEPERFGKIQEQRLRDAEKKINAEEQEPEREREPRPDGRSRKAF